MSKGKIITIEGCDGCGKQTQTEELVKKLNEIGIKAEKISFPTYGSPQAAPAEHYLKGEYGERSDFTPYQISILYEVDRFLTFKKLKLQEKLDSGEWLIFDRYVDSNIIHQTINYDWGYGDENSKEELIMELSDLGYNKFGLPRPDLTFYLNIPYVLSNQLINARGDEKDINEKNQEFLKKSHENGYEIAKYLNWVIIECFNVDSSIYPITLDNQVDLTKFTMKSIEEISDSIFSKVKEIQDVDKVIDELFKMDND